MKPIIRWGLWDRRWAMFFWSLGTGIYIALNILVYSSIRGQADAFNRILEKLPSTSRSLFTDNADILSPVGYLSAKLYYLMLPLLFTTLAISLASHLLKREEDNGTLELLLARPISRGRLLFAKLATSWLVLGVVGTSSLLVTLAAAQHINYGVANLHLVQATLMTLLLSMLFGSVAWAVVGVGRVGRLSGVGIAGIVALASYLFTSLESIASWLHWPAKLLPYHYFQPSAILRGDYNWWNAVGMGAATVILLLIAYWGFRRRDIG